MILGMSRVRILGPRERLAEVLRVVQDAGVLHVTAGAPRPRLAPASLDARDRRHAHQLRRALEDVEAALTALGASTSAPKPSSGSEPLARAVRTARHVRRRAEETRRRLAGLEEERALLERYRQYLVLFEGLLRMRVRWKSATAYHLVMRAGEPGTMDRLRASLRTVIGEEFELRARRLPSGETAILLLITAEAAKRVERVLAEAGVREIPLPASYGGGSLAESLPRMIDRMGTIPGALDAVRREIEEMRRQHGPALEHTRAAIHDQLGRYESFEQATVTDHVFVLEGWIPKAALPTLRRRLDREIGESVAMEEVAAEEWATREAPVVLANPRLFRPFEAVVRLLPLPRYGSIDPTPFVAVFFPMFFGLILGDVAYGALLAALGLVLHARSQPGTVLRDVAEISGPCAGFSILFGLAYGEAFGDLGRRWLGLAPLVFDREESVIPFLVLALSIGVVHVLLGLGLGVLNAWRHHPRQAVGRGLSAVMIVLIVLALLAGVGVLPAPFFTPSVIALLVAFPILVVVEGVIAPVEFLSILGNILSYARIMALGTASVMLAVVANQMSGAMGSAVVGALFALLFHLVNFALGLFSPTIHALRLHYVEFFGKFYSPGGARYRPLAHWNAPGA